MRETDYNREKAVAYARRWALGRNPAYYNFDGIGGDCTNFVSQCLYAGAGVMNYTPQTGWYYVSASDRAAAWTGVEYLYTFLIKNASVGPYAHEVGQAEAQVGDIVQLGTQGGGFYHTALITVCAPQLLVAAHTFDALDRPLSTYIYDTARFLHIDGVRTW